MTPAHLAATVVRQDDGEPPGAVVDLGQADRLGSAGRPGGDLRALAQRVDLHVVPRQARGRTVDPQHDLRAGAQHGEQVVTGASRGGGQDPVVQAFLRGRL
ncbi:hypothetical protein [Streptomyces sp. NPDC048710]|uniref:hypothetical protein n=1 Tax=Streptomyces sp. NPDC048710 TaxID=3365586 RepID=UPI0037143224